jgi:hypothetical protein
MVNFTPWPLYPRGKNPRCPLDGRLSGPESRSPVWTTSRKFLIPPGLELRLLGRPAYNVIFLLLAIFLWIATFLGFQGVSYRAKNNYGCVNYRIIRLPQILIYTVHVVISDKLYLSRCLTFYRFNGSPSAKKEVLN